MAMLLFLACGPKKSSSSDEPVPLRQGSERRHIHLKPVIAKTLEDCDLFADPSENQIPRHLANPQEQQAIRNQLLSQQNQLSQNEAIVQLEAARIPVVGDYRNSDGLVLRFLLSGKIERYQASIEAQSGHELLLPADPSDGDDLYYELGDNGQVTIYGVADAKYMIEAGFFSDDYLKLAFSCKNFSRNKTWLKNDRYRLLPVWGLRLRRQNYC